MTSDEKQAICDILKYIQKYPQAKHSAEGIAKYWIFQQRLEEKLDTVLAAIRYVVKSGFLEEIHNENNHCYYRANHEKTKDINRELERLEQIESKQELKYPS